MAWRSLIGLYFDSYPNTVEQISAILEIREIATENPKIFLTSPKKERLREFNGTVVVLRYNHKNQFSFYKLTLQIKTKKINTSK